jgi:hypothetical protein
MAETPIQQQENNMSLILIEETITSAETVMEKAGGQDQAELALLIKDLQEAKSTIFVKTKEAGPFLERCHKAVGALTAAVDSEGLWGDETQAAFGAFERAVTKLRNTILVRTQRAT